MSLDRQGIRHQAMWELGEECRIVYAVHKKGELSGAPYRWAVQSHTEVDGVGAIYRTLKKEGVKVTSLPSLKNHKKPNWFLRLLYFYRYVRYCGGYHIHYKKEVNWDLVAHPKFLCYSIISKDISQRINKHLKENKLSPTAFFLEIADRVGRQYFLTENSERKWIVPVNMRGPFGKEFDTRNIFASVVFRFYPKNKIDDQFIQKTFRFLLKSNFHWGSWVSGLIQAYMGKERMKNIVKKHPRAVFGLFSNLGKWPNDYIEGECPVHIALAPVTSRAAPFGCALMEFNDQYQLSLLLHPCIDSHNDTTKKLLTQMIESSLAKLGLDGHDLEQELEKQEIKQFEMANILEGGISDG